MKVHITITDNSGKIYGGEFELGATSIGNGRLSKPRMKVSKQTSTAPPRLNFKLPARAFFKKYARELTGPEKFALMLAYFSKGSFSNPIEMKCIEDHWNKMKPLMGGRFNRFYSSTARENGWADNPKKGQYVLLDGWDEIFRN